jgi:hypothetical protein
MIVFDLRCAADHVFEAWFGSSDGYEDQRARGLISCPVCASTTIEKALMAPRLGSGGTGEHSPAEVKAMLGALAGAQAKALEKSRWVGKSFAAEARAMHEGERQHETIHGQASPAEVKSLVADGVPIAPLPLPVVPPDQTN